MNWRRPKPLAVMVTAVALIIATAVRSLLNISEEESEVAVTAGDMAADGSVEVFVDFIGDGAGTSVKMIQPYGEDGIWIPQG